MTPQCLCTARRAFTPTTYSAAPAPPPRPEGNASLLLYFCCTSYFRPFSPIIPTLVVLPVMQEAAGFTGHLFILQVSFFGHWAVRLEAESLQPGSPREHSCHATPWCSSHASGQGPQGPVLSWSGSRGGRQPDPAAHHDLGPRNLKKRTLLKSPCSALQQHGLKPCKFFFRINKIPQEPT